MLNKEVLAIYSKYFWVNNFFFFFVFDSHSASRLWGYWQECWPCVKPALSQNLLKSIVVTQLFSKHLSSLCLSVIACSSSSKNLTIAIHSSSNYKSFWQGRHPSYWCLRGRSRCAAFRRTAMVLTRESAVAHRAHKSHLLMGWTRHVGSCGAGSVSHD